MNYNEAKQIYPARGVRRDSDHVVILDDETREIAREIVRCDALYRIYIALDYSLPIAMCGRI
ncbi:MAG: L-rhamnose isomerase [Clostridia bacterium]|nr:L-rhamnose isomerase [Clostridia bacterium]